VGFFALFLSYFPIKTYKKKKVTAPGMLWLSGEDESGWNHIPSGLPDRRLGETWNMKKNPADQLENCSAGFSVHLVFFLCER